MGEEPAAMLVGPQLPPTDQGVFGKSSSSKGPSPQADEDEEEDSSIGHVLDFFGEDDPVEPLAAGEVSALPPAPPRAKLQACDLEMDMFGMPEEDTMDPVD